MPSTGDNFPTKSPASDRVRAARRWKTCAGWTEPGPSPAPLATGVSAVLRHHSMGLLAGPSFDLCPYRSGRRACQRNRRGAALRFRSVFRAVSQPRGLLRQDPQRADRAAGWQDQPAFPFCPARADGHQASLSMPARGCGEIACLIGVLLRNSARLLRNQTRVHNPLEEFRGMWENDSQS